MKAFRNYTETHCKGDRLQARIDSLTERAMKERPDLKCPSKEWLSGRIAAGLADNRTHFETFKKHFFMHDLLEDNRKRFNPQYDEILSAGEKESAGREDC